MSYFFEVTRMYWSQYVDIEDKFFYDRLVGLREEGGRGGREVFR